IRTQLAQDARAIDVRQVHADEDRVGLATFGQVDALPADISVEHLVAGGDECIARLYADGVITLHDEKPLIHPRPPVVDPAALPPRARAGSVILSGQAAFPFPPRSPGQRCRTPSASGPAR